MTLFRAIMMAGSLCFAMPAFAQDEAEQADVEQADVSPEVAALIEEIDAFGAGDPSADPEGDLEKIADLRRRVEENGELPDFELGNLESAEGAAHFYLRDYEAAADAYGRAAEYYESGNAPLEDMAGLYNNRATILSAIGRYEEALVAHRRALEIRQELEGERGAMVSSSLFGIGFVYYRQGRIEESLVYLRESAEQQLEFVGPDDPNTIIRLTSLASVLGRSGREAESLEVARRAASLAREHLGEDHPTYAIAVHNLGTALVENRIFNEAVPVLRQALDARLATVGEEASGTALTLRNLATALKQTGADEEAEVLTRRALEIYEATGEVETPFALSYMYAELADFSARRGDWEEFEAQSDRSLELADAALEEDNAEQAHLHLYRAEWQMQRGDIEGALAIAERWVPVMQADLIERHKDRIWAELLLARLRQMNGAPASEVITLADNAIGRMEARLGDLVATDTALVREANSHAEAASLYLALASEMEDGERIFRAMQLSNISELSRGQQFSQSHDGDETGALAMRNRLLDLGRKSAELRARLEAAQTGGSDETADLLAALEEADAAVRTASAELSETYPDFVARYRPQPVSLADFQAKMRADDLLLAPVEGASETWVVAVTADAARSTMADSGDVATHVAALRAAIEAPGSDLDSFPVDDAHDLFRALLPEGLDGATRVLVHGGDRLASLPFAMLVTAPHDGDLRDAPWLVRSASVQVVSNLSLFNGASDDAASSSTRFVGVGGSDLPGTGTDAPVQMASLFRSGRPDLQSIAGLPPLPAAGEELENIARAFPEGERLLLVGADAAEERFKQADLSDVAVLAFATHGLVTGEIAGLWEPALLLGTSGPDSGEDGLLGASEIARLSIDADWVIVSACNTAAGGHDGAPPFSGLATAFAQAGARSLLLSHWRVRDDAAAFLSVRTVEAAERGEDRAGALQTAQLALLNDQAMPGSAHPAVWAPFVLIEN